MLKHIARGIDRFNKVQGEVSSLLILPLLFVVIYEVFMRYIVNRPTQWGFEVTTFLYGVHYMLGLAYTERYNGHVQVDIFIARLPPRLHALMQIIAYLVLFLPVMLGLTIWSYKFAWVSWLGREKSWTSWAPPLYPIKFLMFLCFLFLLLQGVSVVIKKCYTLLGKPDTQPAG